GHLAGCIGRQIVHQENAKSLDRAALDLRISADTERPLADVAEGNIKRVGKPGCKGNSRGFRASDGVEIAGLDHGLHRGRCKPNGFPPEARLTDQQPAIDIDGACPARSQNEWAIAARLHGTRLAQKTRGCRPDVAGHHGLTSPRDQGRFSSPRNITTLSSSTAIAAGTEATRRLIS